MELVRFGLLALAVTWALQLIAGWAHMRYYRDTLRKTARTWGDGFLGVGTFKPRIGRGAVAIVVISDDRIVRQVLAMSGLTVFARFEALSGFNGGSIGEFQQHVASSALAPRLRNALHSALDMACRAANVSHPIGAVIE
ncbi:transcriptional regulator GutM [Burkholderia orbicola]|uniref:transcriptional regulator GutM n=1 Tax=Burkholderia TaxID=32008 RepID=UPI00075D2A59|nr:MULTISPECIES: transcriptional regulator GutM [Burkholderia]AQQ26730.1 hypothetical protein A8E88_14260 [Burkholderia cenocepacia]KVS31419.1 hypothetical protein WK36_22920 [Burkholderia cepacia]MCA8120707.1 transcriptional regulator GutM [Burkholderia cepacia]MDN7779570.1 transcriptional regulator GutM [Burkholderia orbicola]MDN7990110.1 transcriptional regulator GutM [Burkholderia orbicola]